MADGGRGGGAAYGGAGAGSGHPRQWRGAAGPGRAPRGLSGLAAAMWARPPRGATGVGDGDVRRAGEERG